MASVEQDGHDREPEPGVPVVPSSSEWENRRVRVDGQVFLLERLQGTQDPFTYDRLGPGATDDALDDIDPFSQHSTRPPRPPSALPRSFRLWVDGELFHVRRQEDRDDGFDYSRLTGPDPGHGFSTNTGRAHWDMADHLEQCRWFLWIVDPDTGHIEDD